MWSKAQKPGNGLTIDNLWLEKVLRHSLHARVLNGMLESRRNILDNDVTGQLGYFLT
jgi:hypothetical protein